MQPDSDTEGRKRRFGLYIPDGHKAVECEDVLEWAAWYEVRDCRVAHDQIGDYEVSTVFRGLDANMRRRFDPCSPPLLFETMVFSGLRAFR